MSKVLVGLGNPGEKYFSSRHNVGFLFLDKLSEIMGVNSEWEYDKATNAQLIDTEYKGLRLMLVKPQTYMNNSGVCVKKIVEKKWFNVNKDLYLIHDDLDIQLGKFKIQSGKSPKDHKGVLSVESNLAQKNFWRVRIGVDNRDNNDIPGESYVLMKMDRSEIDILNGVIDAICLEILNMIVQI